ncbi:MAG TPA: response regulator [Candidatus Binatia bacterium]|nr:response regulator [Candidatus Binatia bacterium]
MVTTSTTVFLIDDDPSVRRALTRLIKSAGYQVQTFASAQEFLGTSAGIEEGTSTCLVLDVSMPGLSGMDLQRELQSKHRNLPIVFVTGHGDIPMSVKAMKAGAVDFLPKPVKEVDLLRAIKQALARASREQAEREEVESLLRRVNTLTPREREVMALVASGLPNKIIAFKLGTVEKTIKVHRARIMDKMEAESLPDLVRTVEKLRLANPTGQ